jgi:tetratricopeptide (TPR) repeat protein
VSLIAAANDSLMWGEEYDSDPKDVFAMQDSIAHSVAAQLRVTLSGGAGMTLVRKETDDPEAHALYLQGLYQWNLRTAEALGRAISLFQAAVDHDSSYARAYAGLGMAYVLRPTYDNVPTDAMLSKAVDAAHRALARDSTLPEAHAVLGFAHAINFENAAAEGEFATALRFDSSFATGHFWHSLLLGHVGRSDEGLREADRARVLEPASLVILLERAHQLYLARRYDAADSVATERSRERGVLGLDPTFQMALYTRGRILADLSKFDQAIAILEPLSYQANLRSAEKLGALAYMYARAGHAAQARATLRRLPADTLVAVGGAVAAALDALGDREAAVAMFKRAVAQHDPWIFLWGRSAPYDGLRKDPRLAALFAKIESPR